jgi:anti-sigma factor RsiW
MVSERNVAGLRCGEILAELSDYLDGEVQPQRRSQIEAHLAGCDQCERFGKEFSASVAALRRAMLTADPETSEVFRKLQTQLDHRD